MLESTHLSRRRWRKENILRNRKMDRGDKPRRERKFRETETYNSRCANPNHFERILENCLRKELRRLRNLECFVSWDAGIL